MFRINLLAERERSQAPSSLQTAVRVALMACVVAAPMIQAESGASAQEEAASHQAEPAPSTLPGACASPDGLAAVPLLHSPQQQRSGVQPMTLRWAILPEQAIFAPRGPPQSA